MMTFWLLLQVLIGKDNLTAVEVFNNYFMLGNRLPNGKFIDVYHEVPRASPFIMY